jgi:hypothetical protein
MGLTVELFTEWLGGSLQVCCFLKSVALLSPAGAVHGFNFPHDCQALFAEASNYAITCLTTFLSPQFPGMLCLKSAHEKKTLFHSIIHEAFCFTHILLWKILPMISSLHCAKIVGICPKPLMISGTQLLHMKFPFPCGVIFLNPPFLVFPAQWKSDP